MQQTVTANPLKKTVLSGLIVVFLGGLMIIGPSLAGIDGFDGGFAISFVGIIFAVVGVIVMIFYAYQSRILDRILRGDGLLLHWTYSPEMWQEYTEKEYEEEIVEKKGLFFVVSAFALFFGVLFWVIDPEGGFFVFLLMLGLIALIAFTWRFSAWYYRRENRAGVGEAYVARDGLFMNRRFYTWRLPGSWLSSVKFEEKSGLSLLKFNLTALTMVGPQTYIFRVPVPYGQEENAKAIPHLLKPGSTPSS